MGWNLWPANSQVNEFFELEERLVISGRLTSPNPRA